MIFKILTSRYFIAIIISIPLLFLLPGSWLKKYTLERIETHGKNFGVTQFTYFEDLAGNGALNMIHGILQPPHFAFIYFDETDALVRQCNFYGAFHEKLNQLFYGDADDDGLLEVYGFTLKADSLFLNWYEPYDSNYPDENHVFIDRLATYQNGLFDTRISDVETVDWDNDGNLEIVFTVYSGFNRQPRRAYVYHPDSKELIKSKPNGISLSALYIDDLNNDGKKELIVGNNACSNLKEDEPFEYKDNLSYLVVFNNDLDYLFPPKPMQYNIGSSLKNIVVESTSGKEKVIVSLCRSLSPKNNQLVLYRHNAEGGLIDSLNLTEYGVAADYNLFKINKSELILGIGNNQVLEMTNDFTHRKLTKLKIDVMIKLLAVEDLNEDGSKEFIFCSLEGSDIYVYSSDFKHRNDIHLNRQWLYTQENINPEKSKFLINTGNSAYVYHYAKNPIYSLRFIIWLLVYLGVLLVVTIIEKLQRVRLENHYILQKQVRDLQLATFKNQLHPHLIFNTFNGITAEIMKGNKEEAYDTFSSLMTVLRTSMENTEKILIPLRSELNLVESFVEIQQFRFKALFEFKLDVDEGVNPEMVIPKMILQMHVENAIKHGLRPKEGHGMLLLKIQQKTAQEIQITIEDNGVGRSRAKELDTDGTGLGLKTVEQFIKQVNQTKDIHVKQQITDLFDEQHQASGTRVVIEISTKQLTS